MKFVKLFLIAALLIGGFFLLKIAFSPKTDSIQINTGLNDELKEYKDKWEAMAQWDSTLFNGQITQINDNYALGTINESTKENQIRLVHNYAKDATCKKLSSLYRSAHYNDSAIDANLRGLDVLQRHVALRNDHDIKTMKEVKKQYFTVKEGCEKVKNRTKDFYIGKISFSGNAKTGLSWKSYGAIKNEEYKKIQELTNNDYFKDYLTGNQDLQALISDANKNISSFEKEYYEGLKNKIKSTYNNARPEIKKLNYERDANNLRRQYSNNTIPLSECKNGLDELKKSYNAYKEKQDNELKALKKGLETTVRNYNNDRSDKGLNDYKNDYNESLTEPFSPSVVFKYPN